MHETAPNRLAFTKMHGLGNDFLIVDSRHAGNRLSRRLVQRLGDRRTGVGFDQLADIRPASAAAAKLVFFNSDGSRSSTCGNATRCVARRLMEETGRDSVTLETERGQIACRDLGDGTIDVNMGQPIFDWQAIPLAREVDVKELPIDGRPAAVGLGNPHCVFIVDDAESINVRQRGSAIETDPLFPKRTNVEFVSISSDSSIRMRVWERGAGLTRASGSGACAAAICTRLAGATRADVTVHTDGGDLRVDWRDDGVWLAGPTAHVFDGVLTMADAERA